MMKEISLNILDVVQNSVTAKSLLTEISVVIDTITSKLSIIIKDSGCGMSETTVANVLDPFYTTRTTRKVGLGLSFFKMGAELTGGNLTIKSKVGIGTTVTAWFFQNHIDCMPLGDMVSTILTLIQGNPEIDFVYRYQVDEHMMVADTREFKTAIEGVPLNEIWVLTFIKEYLEENMAEVNRLGNI